MIKGFLAAVTAGLFGAHHAPLPPPRVTITQGALQGVRADGVEEFLGIPFAAPPVGALRWEPPAAPVSWGKLRHANGFGPRCAQNQTLGVFAVASSNEDCLYLNLYRPAAVSKTLRPVMVWIHGGGLYDGSGQDYDPGALVSQGDVIAVTFNYRVGVLGFLPHPALDHEGHPAANYGLMDQQAALRWVQANIAAFGGDPRQVTLFGESAGGASVYAQMASPGAAGLFQRAIVESGGYEPDPPAAAREEADGSSFAVMAGCPSQTAQCLRGLSTEAILAAQLKYEPGLTVDGTVLPETLRQAFASGHFNHVPVITGTNAGEGAWFVAVEQDPPGKALAADAYAPEVLGQYGTNEGAITALYPESSFNSASAALGRVETDSLFACPNMELVNALAGSVPVNLYEFADVTAPDYMPSVGFDLGAGHTFEIGYLFQGFHGANGMVTPLNPAQQQLSHRMIADWTGFAHGKTPWALYHADKPQSILFKLPEASLVNDYAEAHHCGFWQGKKTPWNG